MADKSQIIAGEPIFITFTVTNSSDKPFKFFVGGDTRNTFLILAIHHSPGGPQYHYKFHSDPNSDGTPEQIEENRRILAALRKWMQEQQ